MHPRDVVSHQHELHARDVEREAPDHFVCECCAGICCWAAVCGTVGRSAGILLCAYAWILLLVGALVGYSYSWCVLRVV
jgi:hypothetical protein